MSTVRDRVCVLLTEAEVDQLRREAGDRNHKESRCGRMTYSTNCYAGQEAHLIGLKGELAVARYYDVARDTRVLDHGDDGKDLFVPGLGVTQVKATTYLVDPHLRAEVEHDKPSIDTYFSVIVPRHPPQVVELVGWLPRADVIDREPMRYGGSGIRPWNYLVLEAELRPAVFDYARLRVLYSCYCQSLGGDVRKKKEFGALLAGLRARRRGHRAGVA